jgi:hypothetical protein
MCNVVPFTIVTQEIACSSLVGFAIFLGFLKGARIRKAKPFLSFFELQLPKFGITERR